MFELNNARPVESCRLVPSLIVDSRPDSNGNPDGIVVFNNFRVICYNGKSFELQKNFLKRKLLPFMNQERYEYLLKL